MPKPRPGIRFRNSLIHGFTRALMFMVRVLPAGAAYSLGHGLALLAWACLPSWRRNSERNLQIFYKNDPLGQPAAARKRAEIARRSAVNLGYTVIEFLRMAMLPVEQGLKVVVDEEGTAAFRAILAEARAQQRGAIALSMHYGNWEALGAYVTAHVSTLCAVGKEQSDDFFTQLAFPWRRRYGIEMIFAGDKVNSAILRALRDGKILGLISDQNGGRAGIFADFAGTMASSVPGPAALSLRTGAPLVLTYLRRLSPGRLKFYARHLPIPTDLPAEKDAAISALMSYVNAAYVEVIREDPTQWLWGHKRWKTRPPGEASLY